MNYLFWNWAGWHIVKWVFGTILVLAIVFTIWKLNTDLTLERRIHEDTINAVTKLIYDTKLSAEDVVRVLSHFIERRYK